MEVLLGLKLCSITGTQFLNIFICIYFFRFMVETLQPSYILEALNNFQLSCKRVTTEAKQHLTRLLKHSCYDVFFITLLSTIMFEGLCQNYTFWNVPVMFSTMTMNGFSISFYYEQHVCIKLNGKANIKCALCHRHYYAFLKGSFRLWFLITRRKL